METREAEEEEEWCERVVSTLQSGMTEGRRTNNPPG